MPAPGEPGSETWPKGEQWKTGGAPVWVTGNYDPETGLAYWGTGNGGPWMGDQRPGDNLYTASTVAIDVKTGQIRGHFQYHPNDSWDWDEVSPPILIDYQRDGRTVKGLVNVARNGYLWFLERGAGPIGFVRGRCRTCTQTVFRSLDPKTGRPDVDPARKPATGKKAEDICPSHWGGKNWPPIAFSPKTRMIYIPANENLCDWLTGNEVEYEAGERFIGATSGLVLRPGADHVGEVQAWNVDTGAKVWTHPYPTSATWGSMLATGGGLVFTGGTNDRKLHAFDAPVGQAAVGVPDQLRHPRAAVVVHDRRQAVHRRAVRLGRRLARHAEPAEHPDRRRVSRGARGRGDLGVRGAVIGRSLRSAAAIGTRTQTPPRRGCTVRRRTAPGPRWRRSRTP